MQQHVSEALSTLRSRYHYPIDVVVVLGSGLGALGDRWLAGEFPQLGEPPVAIPYKEIPHFQTGGVQGHAGRLLLGSWGEGCRVAMMQGRFHYYEGYRLQEVVFPLRVLRHMGAKRLLVTNAAGGIGDHLIPGDLMLIQDHLNMTGQNPLIGKNEDDLGPRFPDMSDPYTTALRRETEQLAMGLGVPLKSGVYAWMTGPSYESKAEVQMLKRLGADAVGMSTVPEVITAAHMGMDVLGISCITNKAAGLSAQPLSHQEVMETGAQAAQTFQRLVQGILSSWSESHLQTTTPPVQTWG